MKSQCTKDGERALAGAQMDHCDIVVAGESIRLSTLGGREFILSPDVVFLAFFVFLVAVVLSILSFILL